eukprot:TRINITY_DN22649_c0_g3_i2.p1 TRINITY_DN22649_c0_g3~~TRINITY_DN22649_c0_g3_i2.p1  ORF type:complete len:285 (-),score=13.56 TRINITY_DN22649_c0_g3_i2:172-1026(-)
MWWLFLLVMAGLRSLKGVLLTDLIVDLSTWTEEWSSEAKRAVVEQSHFSQYINEADRSAPCMRTCWSHVVWSLISGCEWQEADDLHRILEFQCMRWVSKPRSGSGELQSCLCMISQMVNLLKLKLSLGAGRRRRMQAAKVAKAMPVHVILALSMQPADMGKAKTSTILWFCQNQCRAVTGQWPTDTHFVYWLGLDKCSYVGRTAAKRVQTYCSGPVQRWSEHVRDLHKHRTSSDLGNRKRTRYIRMMARSSRCAPLFLCVDTSNQFGIQACESAWIFFCHVTET